VAGGARDRRAAAQRSRRAEAEGRLSRLHRILWHHRLRYAGVSRRHEGAARAIRSDASWFGVQHRLEPFDFADFWRRVLARPRDPRQRGSPRWSRSLLAVAGFRAEASTGLL